jgi:hypothetical protein
MKKILNFSCTTLFVIVALSSFASSNKTKNTLATNKDFKKWLTGVVEMKTILEKTNTKTSFLKFVNHTSTAKQTEALSAKLGFKTTTAFVARYKQINQFRVNFIKATPSLQTKEANKIFTEALKLNALEVPSCWDIYTIRSMNCFSGGPPETWGDCEERAWAALLNCYDPPVTS